MSAQTNQTNIAPGTANFITRQEFQAALSNLSSLSTVGTFNPNPNFSTISMPTTGSISNPGSIQATHLNVSTTGRLITSRTSGNSYIGVQNTGGSANQYVECAGILTAVLPGTGGAGQQGVGYAFNGINGLTSSNTSVPFMTFNGSNYLLSNISNLQTTTGGSINASIANLSTVNAGTFSTNSLSIINLTTSNINTSTILATNRVSTTALTAGSITTNSFASGVLTASNLNIAQGTSSFALYVQGQPFGNPPSLSVAYQSGASQAPLEANSMIVCASNGSAGTTSPALTLTPTTLNFVQSGSGTSRNIISYNLTNQAALSNISSINGNSVGSIGAWMRYNVTNVAGQSLNLTNSPQLALTFTGIPGTIGGIGTNAINISVPINISHSGTAAFPINVAAWIGGSITNGYQVNAQYSVVNGSTGGTVTLSGVCTTTGTTNSLAIYAWTDSSINPTNVVFVQGSGLSRNFFFQQVY